MPHIPDRSVHASPVAEGVRFQTRSATAFAVRKENKDVALRIRREYHPARDAMERIPFVRGIVRLVGGAFDFVDGISESGQLMPQQIVRGSRFESRFAELFRVNPTNFVAVGSAIVILFMLVGLVLLGPWALAKWVLPQYELSRPAINAVACVARVVAMLLSAVIIPRLRVISRLCMYRGAINKVLNTPAGRDGSVSQAQAEKAPYLTRRSDAAFVVTVLILSVIAFALVRVNTLPVQLLSRVLIVLCVAAIVNEPLRLLENAKPSGLINVLMCFHLLMERCMTRKPHPQMVEVAVLACNAARENDR